MQESFPGNKNGFLACNGQAWAVKMDTGRAKSIPGNKNGLWAWEIIPWGQVSIFEARIPFLAPRWLIPMTGNHFYILFVNYFTLVKEIKI